MPSSLHAQITRNAISPRFATRIFLNMMWKLSVVSSQLSGKTWRLHRSRSFFDRSKLGAESLFCWPDGEQFLAVLDGLAVGDELFDQLPGYVAFDFVHQFHGFNDAQYLADLQGIADLDERRRTRRRRLVKGPDNRRLHNMQAFRMCGRSSAG